MVEKLDRSGIREGSLWRRWGDYALGVAVEAVAVGTIALVALLIMYLVKLIVK